MDEYIRRKTGIVPPGRTGIEEEREYFARLQREARIPLLKRLFQRR
ncbi:hypothetical protein [Pontivivens insulae]|uniref:Uncharacterized protein n=1 Tax=Pontivivens insulae TaxID=1639689 RepID=A0A2R8AA07_9RHOB|nr:hypothetical protein [Pontivivens insulae]RED12958.1 hypothetical protein DFR53_2092 [Pontivivens insulae]SPF29051.1 hypothetical protein POI8812_01356 [Pontivivens insulae]